MKLSDLDLIISVANELSNEKSYFFDEIQNIDASYLKIVGCLKA